MPTQLCLRISVITLIALTRISAEPVAYPTLNPPAGVTPAMTRQWFPWSCGKPTDSRTLPKQAWTPEQRHAYEKRVEWFHDAKFGLFFHFLAFGEGLNNFPSVGFQWTSEKWNAWVDAVDVDKVADQAQELGAGYVIITLGQNHRYACAPNPVLDKLWQLQPGQFNSRRDLPMDLYKALAKRNIPMMLYIAADNQHKLPTPASFKGTDARENWLKVIEWYSDHYGSCCKGWWVDGLRDDFGIKDYRVRLHQALKRGNPDALVASGHYEISDFVHGHCQYDWNRQQQQVKPYFGRWDPDFKIQWHTFQFIGHYWAASDTPKKTVDLANYAAAVVKGGGVITFDVGMYRTVDGTTVGPCLEIQENQLEQLRAVREALKDIPPTDGAEMAPVLNGAKKDSEK
ncbi:MAG: hypothetical protein WCJ14_00825 [Verrucomicrobiota bacterium]